MLRRGQSHLGCVPESSSDVLAAMSISMSTTIARTLGLASKIMTSFNPFMCVDCSCEGIMLDCLMLYNLANN